MPSARVSYANLTAIQNQLARYKNWPECETALQDMIGSQQIIDYIKHPDHVAVIVDGAPRPIKVYFRKIETPLEPIPADQFEETPPAAKKSEKVSVSNGEILMTLNGITANYKDHVRAHTAFIMLELGVGKKADVAKLEKKWVKKLRERLKI